MDREEKMQVFLLALLFSSMLLTCYFNITHEIQIVPAHPHVTCGYWMKCIG